MSAGTLYVVATPIGNLEDITARALRVLREADMIACEDTRRTGLLLHHYGIETRMLRYHEHNERECAVYLNEQLGGGLDVALVTDAGTPGISDPGFRLVRLAAAGGIRVVPVPGPSAFVAALVASALPSDQFFFGGFLPARTGQRRARLRELRDLGCTLVFYEAPHRIGVSLRDASEILGRREAALARELTKVHEEIARGDLWQLAERFSGGDAARGEMVLVVGGKPAGSEPVDAASGVETALAARVAALEAQGLSARAALKQAARELGLGRSDAYRRLASIRSEREG